MMATLNVHSSFLNRQGKRSVGEAWENEGESAVKVRQGESHETLPELCKRHEALVSTN